MRVGEALALNWTDIDFERRTVRITAEKGSLPRILPLSEKAIAMLKRLPKKDEKYSHVEAPLNAFTTLHENDQPINSATQGF